MASGSEQDGGLVVGVHDFAVITFGRGEQHLQVALFALDAVLLGLEEVEGDGVGQVCALELGALVVELGEPVADAAGLGGPVLSSVFEVGGYRS